MNPSVGYPISFWLLPRRDDAAHYQARIDALARRFNTPVFAPHVTIGVSSMRPGAAGATPDLSGLQQSLVTLGAALAPLELPAQAIATGASRFQCVFVTLPTEPVVRLAQRLSGPVSACTDAPLIATAQAHLSLVYADLDAAARHALAASLSPPPPAIRFDRIAIVTPGVGRTDFTDPARWQAGEAVALTGVP